MKFGGNRNKNRAATERNAQDGLRMIFLHNDFMGVKLKKACDLLNVYVLTFYPFFG